jgi:hypothetical protein
MPALIVAARRSRPSTDQMELRSSSCWPSSPPYHDVSIHGVRMPTFLAWNVQIWLSMSSIPRHGKGSTVTTTPHPSPRAGAQTNQFDLQVFPRRTMHQGNDLPLQPCNHPDATSTKVPTRARKGKRHVFVSHSLKRPKSIPTKFPASALQVFLERRMQERFPVHIFAP